MKSQRLYDDNLLFYYSLSNVDVIFKILPQMFIHNSCISNSNSHIMTPTPIVGYGSYFIWNIMGERSSQAMLCGNLLQVILGGHKTFFLATLFSNELK